MSSVQSLGAASNSTHAQICVRIGNKFNCCLLILELIRRMPFWNIFWNKFSQIALCWLEKLSWINRGIWWSACDMPNCHYFYSHYLKTFMRMFGILTAYTWPFFATGLAWWLSGQSLFQPFFFAFIFCVKVIGTRLRDFHQHNLLLQRCTRGDSKDLSVINTASLCNPKGSVGRFRKSRFLLVPFAFLFSSLCSHLLFGFFSSSAPVWGSKTEKCIRYIWFK